MLVFVGLALANVLEMVRRNHTVMMSLFHSAAGDITIDQLEHVIEFQFSEVGSNVYEK